MKLKLLICLLSFTGMAEAQKLSVGAYLSMSRGCIARKEMGPVIMPGLGLACNYYYKNLVLNAGLGIKGVGGSWNIMVTTANQPDGIGPRNILYFMQIFQLPVGLNYMFLKNEKLRLMAGMNIDNGYILNPRYQIDGMEAQNIKEYKRYYFGIAPRLGAEYNVSARKFLFLNLGYAKQINQLLASTYFNYNIQNLYAELGFAYRLGE